MCSVQDVFFEMQPFCAKFGTLREAAGLYKLMKQVQGVASPSEDLPAGAGVQAGAASNAWGAGAVGGAGMGLGPLAGLSEQLGRKMQDLSTTSSAPDSAGASDLGFSGLGSGSGN